MADAQKEKSINTRQVIFSVVWPDLFDVPLSDFQKLEKDILIEIKNILNRYHIDGFSEAVGGRGGGPAILWEILKELWLKKEYIGMFIALIKYFFDRLKDWKNHREEQTLDFSSPKLTLGFRLEDDGEYKIGDDLSLVNAYLINLKFVADEVCEVLTKKYPSLTFNQWISLSLLESSFRISFSFPQKRRVNSTLSRFIHLVKNTRLRPKLTTSYDFPNPLIVRRSDFAATRMTSGGWMSDGNRRIKRYYLVFSNNVLRDFFSN